MSKSNENNNKNKNKYRKHAMKIAVVKFNCGHADTKVTTAKKCKFHKESTTTMKSAKSTNRRKTQQKKKIYM